MNKADLRRLKKRLKKISRFRDKIAKKTGFSLSYIDFVLNANDDRYNQEIIDAAFEVIDEFDKKENERMVKYNEILNKK
ncbi:MAG: hypothetical protein N4A59_06305 [Marinifilum sp.]|jgi:hypothetical protein|nr:hypothetical protein [Marinifilum sp.]